MHTLTNGGITNLLEWVKHIVDNFCKEQDIDERASYDNIKYHFHDDFHESFICTVPTLLFKFLIDKGVAHIGEPRPLLIEPRPMLVEPRFDNDKSE